MSLLSNVVSSELRERNFPNRLGQGADVFLALVELSAITSVLGKLPSVEEYMQYASKIDSMAPEIYKYMNFDQMPVMWNRLNGAGQWLWKWIFDAVWA